MACVTEEKKDIRIKNTGSFRPIGSHRQVGEHLEKPKAMKKKNPEYVKRGKKGILTTRQKAGDHRLSEIANKAVASREKNQKKS